VDEESQRVEDDVDAGRRDPLLLMQAERVAADVVVATSGLCIEEG
jgi:hypothetical protein